MGQAVRFQETLRKPTVIDEGFIERQARLGLATAPALDPKTAALLRRAAPVAIGSPAAGGMVRWRALAAGAAEDEIAEALVAVVPVAGLGRVVAAAPEVATALGDDIEAALEGLDDG